MLSNKPIEELTLYNMCEPNSGMTLKSDLMSQWAKQVWQPQHPDQDWLTLWAMEYCVQADVIAEFDRSLILPQGYRFVAAAEIECPIIPPNSQVDWQGNITYQSGAFIYRFAPEGEGAVIEALVMGTHFSDQDCYQVTMACVPRAFQPVWTAFERECYRLATALEPSNQVIIIGGRANSFVPTVNWDEIVLPEVLKVDLLEDVRSFFTKGIDIYKRLNLKPFRKLLLAGVPGTGKTMICSALAKWALEQGYVVIYVSSAYKSPHENYGSTFTKIQQALSVAASSQYPALILLEELDAYLHPEEKAVVLNVLDGSESTINDKGTLLISTTNYPEAIDERVLKRPGRLDRIFIIPETRVKSDAEQMLRQYLGAVWREEHRSVAAELVGYPGAFIREVAVYALTQMAYDDLQDLPLDMLCHSYSNLKAQIAARDDFLKQRVNGHAAESIPS
jgi:hypothetical protein